MHQISEFQAAGVVGIKKHHKGRDNVLRGIGQRTGRWVNSVGEK